MGERDGRAAARIAVLGASAQVTIVGAYAWAVTVAPLAWAPGSPRATRIAAGAALASLGGGASGERWELGWTRPVSLWGFVLSSALTWLTFPAGLGASHEDPIRGLAGMLGWGLFAFAYAAPALRPAEGSPRAAPSPARRPPVERGGGWYLSVGALLAVVLQVPGWTIEGAERALAVRLAGVAGGLAVLGAAVGAATERHRPRAPRRRASAALRPAAIVVGVAALALAAWWGTRR